MCFFSSSNNCLFLWDWVILIAYQLDIIYSQQCSATDLQLVIIFFISDIKYCQVEATKPKTLLVQNICKQVLGSQDAL